MDGPVVSTRTYTDGFNILVQLGGLSLSLTSQHITALCLCVCMCPRNQSILVRLEAVSINVQVFSHFGNHGSA